MRPFRCLPLVAVVFPLLLFGVVMAETSAPLTPNPSPQRGEGGKNSAPLPSGERGAKPTPLSPLGRGVGGEGNDTQEFVFLSEARPLLVRLHVRVDGKPLQAAWDDFQKYLFAYLDANGDGFLNEEELESVPSVQQLSAGVFGLIGGPSSVKLADLDSDKDGKVSPAELPAHYRKNGFTPMQYQFQLTEPRFPGQELYMGSGGPEPEVAAVSKAAFEHLDTNKDGKLTKEELAAAPDVLLALDENEDEVITTRELAREEKPASKSMGSSMVMGMMGGSNSAGKKMLLPLAAPGEAPADLAERIQARYGAKSKEKDKDKKLARADLGLDEATFARLDTNRDGVLDAKELAGFVKHPADLCVILRFGPKETRKTWIELAPVAGRPALFADKVQKLDTATLLDLGRTRVQLRHREEKQGNYLASIIRQQLTAQFDAQDKDGNGYLDKKEFGGTDAKESRRGRLVRTSFKSLDRDGDGKITRQEWLAYFDKIDEMQQRAAGGCATLVLRDQSRGLFDLIDTNRDGRLSVREMRQAVNLLARFDAKGKGYLSREDIPTSYEMAVRPGPKEPDGFGQQAAFFNRLFSGSAAEERQARGPAWFRKMDRNRDGDVSRKEFLFSDELFRKLDTDGDGLISIEEAEKAGHEAPRTK